MRRVLALLTLLPALVACGGGGHEQQANGPATPANVIVYETRGRVETLPDPTLPMSDFLVHHEPIPGFKNSYDETTPGGMNSMVMPFPPADDVDLGDVSVGDILALRFQVDYDPENGTPSGMSLLSFERLPEDTTLDLGRVPHPHDH